MSMMNKARARELSNVTLFEPTRQWLATDRWRGLHVWQPQSERWARLLVRRERAPTPTKRTTRPARYAGHHDSGRSAHA